MANKKIEVNPEHIEAIRIYFKDGNYIRLECDDVEINRLMDELLIYESGCVKARFYTHQIAGYYLEDYIEYSMACEED